MCNNRDVGSLNCTGVPAQGPALISVLRVRGVTRGHRSKVPIVQSRTEARKIQRPRFVSRENSFLMQFFGDDTRAGTDSRSTAPNRSGGDPHPTSIRGAVLTCYTRPQLT